MKKITTSGEDISFRIDGSTVLSITKAGCLTTDENAAIAEERLGGAILVSDVSLEEAAQEVLDTPLEEVVAPVEEVMAPVEEAPEVAPVEEPEAAIAEEPVAEEKPAPKTKKSKSK